MNPVFPMLTWVVVLAEFLLNVAGERPSPERRDLNLAVGAVVLLALQIPLLVRWTKMARDGGTNALPRREIVWTLIRLGFAGYVFWFLHAM